MHIHTNIHTCIHTYIHTYTHIQLNLGPDQLGEDALATLFDLADSNKSGTIDFSEFLSAVIGNIASV